MAHQRAFGFERSFRVASQPYPVRYPENMSIDSHRLFVECHRCHDIGRFTTYPRQFLQFVYILGHDAVEVADQFTGHTHQMFRFIVGVRNAFDVFINLFGACCGKALGRRIFFEEGRRNHVYPLVGTLSRQDDGYNQLIRVFVA